MDVVLGPSKAIVRHAFRLLRASKNRFGSTERGRRVHHAATRGSKAVANPSELFLAERRAGASGSAIVPLVEGTRPMLVELQALVAPAPYGSPRRTCLGVEDGRVALLLAVLGRRSEVELVARDVYVNAVGGVRVREPAADLAIALALASSSLDIPLPPELAACGEIGLGGEVRRVSGIDLRVREAARLGFRELWVPKGARAAVARAESARIVEVRDVAEAVNRLRANAGSQNVNTG